MTIDELMKENTDVLHRMKEEDEANSVRRQAHEWWNWDIPPRDPTAVALYIRDNPTEFRGVVPM